MTYYSLSALVNFLSVLTLGSLIFYRNPKNIINQTFTLFAFSTSLWSLFYFLWQVSNSSTNALYFTRILMAFATFIPLFYLHFIFSLLEILNRKKFFLILSYLLFLFFSTVSLTTPYIVSHTEPLLDFPFWPMPGLIFHLFLLAWVIYIGYTVYLLFKNFQKSTGLKKIQLKYLILGTIIGYGGGITNYFLWYKIPIPPLGNIFITFYVAITAYAIAKHRFLDVRLVVARTVAYSLLLLITASFYTASIYLLSLYFYKSSIVESQLIVSVVLTLIIALTFQPLRKFLEDTTDKIFFKGAYDINSLLSKLGHIMATNIYLNQITQMLLEELLKSVRVSRGVFVLTEKGKVFDIEAQGYKKTPEFTPSNVFTLMSQGKILVFDELEESPTKELMRKLDINVAAPLKVGQEEVGILMLGEKLSGDVYSNQDLKLLEIFVPEASIAVQNSLAYEEIKRFNVTLKEKVNNATKEIRVANDKLKELDKLKDEFISVTSHELRTPMTAIKSYLWLVLHGKSGKIPNPKMLRYLNLSYLSSERMLILINDLLNVSRIESGRIQINPQPTSLEEMVDLVLSELSSKALERKLDLSFEKPKEKLPLVMLDRERFPEILTNLVGNAIKFTPIGGKITVEAEKSGNLMQMSVKDTGVGISEKDMPKLFTKFGRLDNSYTAVSATGGTGLGLYVTKGLVELHGGKIWVESKLGKGTSFNFTLKVATKEDIAKEGERPVEVKPEGVIYASTH